MRGMMPRVGRLVQRVTVGLALSLSILVVHAQVQPRQAATRAPADPARSLDGTWSYSTLTPVERPDTFAGRPTIPLSEAPKYEAEIMARSNADRRDGPVEADVARAYNEAWYERGLHLAVVDGVAHTSLVVDPPNGRIPALTPDAQRRAQARARQRREHPADGPEDRSLAERCLAVNAGPPLLPWVYNNYVQVYQFADHVVIHNEMIHDARVVPTDGRPHLPAAVRRFQGDSIGRWEGNTLVVDTTNFTAKTAFRGSGEQLHLIERFTRLDASTLLYEFTVDDPQSFTAPWTVQLPMTLTDEQIYEFACHEANHAMVGILGGARFEERQAAGPR